MKKINTFFRKNKSIIFIFVVILSIIFFSFYQYFKDYYSYSKSYYEIKEKCYKKDIKGNKYCSFFSDESQLNNYIENNNPKEKFDKLDAITLTCEIVENNLFSILQLLSPMLIIIAIIGTVHAEFNSGMFKNYLMRMNYKQYLKKKIFQLMKIAFILPCSLIIIFVCSCLITKFNFNVDPTVKNIVVYDSWKYKNFIFYGFMICLLQYIMSIVYGCIGLFYSVKNKNPIITSIIAYITFIFEDLIIYIIIYSIIINKVFGLKELTEYFNITGYWFFNQPMNYAILILIAFLIFLCNFIFICYKLSNKEKVVIENEKQNA
ncbi:MAG: hypothetical protein Q4E39_00755 [bacterium]|nr:hypothetical protein [bacterium]